MQKVLNRLKALLRRRQQEQDLQDELAAHFEMDARERIDAGDTPEEARRDARRDFGNVVLVAEDTRSTWGWTTLEQWMQDLRYSLRNLIKRPSFTVVTVATLGLGIGANTAIFSIVNAALFRPLPYPDPDRLVSVFSVNPSPHGGLWVVAPADFRDWREQSESFERLSAYSIGNVSLWIGERPENITEGRVTGDFFDTLGTKPMLGRGLQPEDDSSGPASLNVVLSHRLWLNRFGGDPNIVGKKVKGALGFGTGFVTIVGVMPPEFKFPDFAEMWAPMGCCGEMNFRATRYWRTVGRLRNGRSIEAVQAEMESIAQRLSEQYPKENRNWTARVLPFDRALVRDVSQALWILMGAVGFVIAIACANIAGLLLVRSASRRREVAVRLALGADRWRLIRQLFVEGFLVSFLGMAVGLLFARWSIGAFFSLLPFTDWTPLVRFREGVHLDGTVLLFTSLISVLTALVLTLVPVWDSLKLGIADSIRTAGKKTQTARDHRLYKSLVVVQFACAIILLAGAGLLTQSFVRMLNIDPGYDPHGLGIMSFLGSTQNRQEFIDQALKRITAAPGIESAAVMSTNRFGQMNNQFNREEKPFPAGDVMVRYSSVTADYFRVLKSRVIGGRTFDSRDSATAPGVAVINEKLAQEYFPGEDPVGRRILLRYNNQQLPREIIGVVSNVRQDSPGEPIKPEILVHWPQLPWLSAMLVIRAKGDASVAQKFAQEAIWSLDKNLPASRTETLEQILNSQVATPRLYMILFGLFSTAAVVLASLGIYGLLGYMVSSRTNELAIRVAVGARRRNILGLVIGEGLLLSVAGILLGLLGTVALTRLMQSLLFEVSPTDPVTFGAVAVLLLAVALAACYLPARRAAKTDPAVALRHD